MHGLSLRTEILIDEVHADVFSHRLGRGAALAGADTEAISAMYHIHVLLIDVACIWILDFFLR